MGTSSTYLPAARSVTQSALVAACLAMSLVSAEAQPMLPQGVFTREIVIGTHVDLSGPLAPWGAAVKNGLTMAIEETNKAGGVDGRTIRLIVKDDGYDSARATDAVHQLVTQDRVFAILSPLGTPTVKASMYEALSRNVLYLFPITASADAFVPHHALKFGLTPTHEMEVQEGLRRILNARGPLKVGVLAADDAFGLAVRQGAMNELARRGLTLATSESFAHGEKGFGAMIAQLRSERVDVVVLGAEANEALAVLRAAQAMRWRPIFLCSSACYAPEFVTLGGPEAEGVYAVGQVPIPYPDDRKLAPWTHRYETRFGSAATVQALTAYRNARFFLAVLRQAGRTPTQMGFSNILETRGAWTDPELGGLPIEFSPVDHLGGHSELLAQARHGRWVILADNLVSALP